MKALRKAQYLAAGSMGAAACWQALEFFDRDPEREVPDGNWIVAPADGKIVSILELKNSKTAKIDKGLFGKIETLTCDLEEKDLTLISIFMPPTAVHVQRMPVPGQVVSVTHREGKFRSTHTVRAIDNERAETVIEGPCGKVKVIQIAGLLARRIETWVREGDQTEAGERFGRIRLGSQVSLFLPSKMIENGLRVRVGDWVRAGETVLAGYESKVVIA